MLRSTKFRWFLVAAVIVLVGGFAYLTRNEEVGPPLRANLGPGPVAATHIVARDGAFSEQQLVCAGDPVPLRLIKFDQPKVIEKVTICDDYPTRHDFTLERSALTQSVLNQLSTSLARPDEPRNDTVMCTMEYPMLASIVIELKSGAVVRPTVPINTCRKPQAKALLAIDAIVNFQFPQD